MWVKDRQEYARVTGAHTAPRSYLLISRHGEHRRNRRQLVSVPNPDVGSFGDPADADGEPDDAPAEQPRPYTTSRGRAVIRPSRFDE